MSDIRPAGRRPTQIAGLVAVLGSLVSACATQPAPEPPPDRPAVRVEPISTTPVSAFEDAPTIIVDSDMVCGESDRPGEEVVVGLIGGSALPFYVDAATVLLNGWRFNYKSSDHHVEFLEVLIDDVEVIVHEALLPGEIHWIARGFFADNDADDGYGFCYVYTVIGWNIRRLDAVALTDSVSMYDSLETETTALGVMSPLIETAAGASSPPRGRELADRRTVVPLPRGYRYINHEDDHVLQVAYHMDHNEGFREGGKDYAGIADTSDLLATERRIDTDHASWESYSIFKDNDLRQPYSSHAAYVAVLGGDDIDVVRPPFTILPAEDSGAGCFTPDGNVKTEEYVIENIPFDYALPMLTGWDLTYGCDDEHVAEVGVWLEDFSYEKAPDAPTGTLRYTLGSVLRDNEGEPNHTIRHKVDILGLNKRLPTDLVPQAKDAQFCNTGPGGLLVTVANVGADDAPASTTRIRFEDGEQEDLPTPPLAKGFAVTLDPVPIPPSCPDPDCSFSIRVDRTDAVVETVETNNTGSGTCVG